MNESLITLIKERRSIRRYLPQPLTEATITTLLQAAVWAPSAHNRQPWRFVVLQSGADKQRLAAAMGQRLRLDLRTDGVPTHIIEDDVKRSRSRLTQAPALIIVCLSLADMDMYPDAARSHNEYIMAVQSVAMAGQNLLLAAHDAGLGACWMCAPLFCTDVVQQTLKLPDDWQAQGLVTVGYPAQERQKTRTTLDSRVIWYK